MPIPQDAEIPVGLLGKKLWVGLLVGVLLSLQPSSAWAVFLDQDESLRFSGRVYNRTAF